MVDLRYVIDYLAYNGIFYLVNEPMQRHTTFQIGGVADVVAYPTRRREICDLTRICKTTDTPLTVIGNGSNILVRDKGVRGLVIMTDRLRRVSVSGTNTIEAWAGAPIAKAANLARNYSLAGLEFAYGIPGHRRRRGVHERGRVQPEHGQRRHRDRICRRRGAA